MCHSGSRVAGHWTQRRGRRPPRRRGGQLHRPRRRQGRPRRPQRRRQDQPASRCSAASGRRRPRGIVHRARAARLPAAGPSHRRRARRRHRAAATCCPGRGLDDGGDPHREAAPRHRGATRASATRALHPGRGAVPHDGGYAAESEVRRSPPASAWPPTASTCPLGVLSGGERRRVELARILFAGSDVLLLDEPTNHLDIDAKAWLMGFLRDYRGALLVISHDLELLDEAITRVIHLDRTDEERRVISSSTRAPTASTSPARGEGRGAPGQAGRRAGQGDRPAPDACVDRCGAKATQGADGPQHREAGRPLEADAVAGPGAPRKTLQLSLPRATALPAASSSRSTGSPRATADRPSSRT